MALGCSVLPQRGRREQRFFVRRIWLAARRRKKGAKRDRSLGFWFCDLCVFLRQGLLGSAVLLGLFLWAEGCDWEDAEGDGEGREMR